MCISFITLNRIIAQFIIEKEFVSSLKWVWKPNPIETNNFLIDVKKGLLFYIPEGSIKRWTETGKREEFSTCCCFHSPTFTALILYILIYIAYKIH